MSAKTINYLDIPQDLRRKGAAEARERASNALANPFTSPEQRTIILATLTRIDEWEQGTIDD